MQRKFKLLLLDVDGTTAPSRFDSVPSAVVAEAVKAAQKHIHVALATGRGLKAAGPIIHALDLHGPSVLEGGAEIVDLTHKKVLSSQFLSVESMREAFIIAQPFGYDIYTHDDNYTTPIQSPEQFTKPAPKLYIDAVSSKDLPVMLEALSGVKEAVAHPTTSWSEGDVSDIHVNHELATKRHGVEKLIALLGCSKDEVIAVGDGYNDIPLLEAAGFKVAMGNAPDEIKAIADFVAPSLDDDGVAAVIEKFIL